jgi:hypothetical protein
LLCVFLLQMILVVIEGLGDKNGSNKLAISSTWRASAASYPHTRIAAYRAPSAHEGVWRAHLPQHYFCADALDAPAKRWRRCHPRCGNWTYQRRCPSRVWHRPWGWGVATGARPRLGTHWTPPWCRQRLGCPWPEPARPRRLGPSWMAHPQA